MHDCLNTREQLVDLIFDELDQEARRRVLLELETCYDCQRHYQSMIETLNVVDQAVETAMPDERYWAGYEAGLRIRLQQQRPGLKQRLRDWMGGFGILTARPLPLVAGLALALMVIGVWWNWQRQQLVAPSTNDPVITRVFPTPPLENPRRDNDVALEKKASGASKIRKHGHPKNSRPVDRPEPREGRREVIVANNVTPMVGDQPIIASSVFTPEAIRHFEKSQLLLRSFRNTGAMNGSAAIDLTYEKQLSQRLLYQNILLRREAEMKGNLPAEEALSDLEPFLLDIANLPDKPSPEELSDIKERLQRKEMIAALYVYSAHPSLPAYQNQ
jgi:hypothetical protein